MSDYPVKGWDWSKNTDDTWLIPCTDSAYLAERWTALGFSDFLDVGCGLGRHSVYMAKHGFRVSAVDISDYAAEHLSKWANKEKLEISVKQSGMHELPFDNDSFDCAMAYNVIYHTDTSGFNAALTEIRRVLRPGGELYLTLLSKNTYGFEHRDPAKVADENTVYIDERETGESVPHRFFGAEELLRGFDGFKTERKPVELTDYNSNDPQYYSRHWMIILKKD